MWCGEVIPTPTLVHWMRRLPHARFTNLYGPTEATIASSYYTVPRYPRNEREPIPIGDACDGEELLILDGRLQPVAPGEIGDLYIRGTGLSPGYWRDQEKTDSVFLPCPGGAGPRDRIYKSGDLEHRGAGGRVYFLARADTQSAGFVNAVAWTRPTGTRQKHAIGLLLVAPVARAQAGASDVEVAV